MTSQSSALPPAKLLLVDDHPANLTALEAVFAPLDCELVFASSGEEALKALLRDDFAAILLDVQMPGLDGFQTASLIRKRKRSRDIPIIFLTAVSKEREFVFRGYEHGAVDYLVKPFHPDILRAKVAVFVELHQRREQVRMQGEEIARRERAALERESSLRYQQLVDLMPQVVFANRPDGTFYLVNRVWSEYTGLDLERTAAGEWLEVIHPEDRETVLTRWQAGLAKETPFDMEVRIRNRAGEHRWFLVRANPEYSEDGKIIGWIGTSTDIDDQRKIREALAAAITAKDDFLAAASHELRTPLAAAKAQVQLSQRRIEPGDDAPIGRALRIVGHQIDRMTRLVEDLLDISRLQTGRLSLQLGEFDLVERLRGEIERLGALSPQHPMSLEAPEKLPIFADRDRIDQVVINLLTNAVRYSPGGGPIRVYALEHDDHVEVAVTDRGVGIPLDKQQTIFERFGRAHGTRYGGLGLGLTIAQGIVEQHGGKIWCESSGNPGEGTTFRFELPLRAEARASLS
jgi:PAS domain S-box-containing protein